MNDLIEIKKTENGYLVEARLLHTKLEVGRDFSTWIKNRLQDFEEEIDYYRSPKLGSEHKIEYDLTLDTCKHIAMLERNEKGKKIRQYFIDFEKNIKTGMLNLSRKQLAQMIIEVEEEKEKLQIELEQNKPKALIYDKISNSNGLKTIQEVAKELNRGPKKFFAALREDKILFFHNNNHQILSLPYQKYIDSGYFEVKEKPYHIGEESYMYSRVYVTPKGLLWLTKKYIRKE